MSSAAEFLALSANLITIVAGVLAMVVFLHQAYRRRPPNRRPRNDDDD